MRRIFVIVFYNKIKIGKQLNRVLLNNTSEKHIEQAFHAFQKYRLWSSNNLLDYNIFGMNSWAF